MHCHCGTNNRAPRWTFTDPCKPEWRPGARESASPAWLAAPAIQSYMSRHRCAGGLDKLYLRSGSQRHRHFAGFFNVPVLHRHGTTLFIRWFRHTAPISRLLRSRWGYGGRILHLNPRQHPHGVHCFYMKDWNCINMNIANQNRRDIFPGLGRFCTDVLTNYFRQKVRLLFYAVSAPKAI